ncbi:EF-hand calcium-binding domain-containing protein 4B-like, partial [Melanerpes formicivorus]|uniref:EF-hand calcium-binding domain-containing protein 4B-like n=1 Tax=Melanerpes formicivorus TaxID=211600 RepID=UPI00358FFC4B
KESDHDREVRCLYEEMEQQIKAERERLICQEALRHERSNLLQKELHSKEQELEKILYHQKKLEHQLQSLNSEQLETRVQNKRLQHLNQNLLEELEKSKWELEAVKGQLQKLQKEAQVEQEQKDRDVFRVSRNMQKEKQSLLRQLELLREVNRRLRDERDAAEAPKPVPEGREPLLRRGPGAGSALPEEQLPARRVAAADLPFASPGEVAAAAEPNRESCRHFPGSRMCLQAGEGGPTDLQEQSRAKERLAAAAERWKLALKGGAGSRRADGLDDAPLPPRGQPVGTETRLQALEPASCSPEHVFKVVFVGNSGVGKSSFIHRLCHGSFLAQLGATIGIDYQVKSLVVDHTQVALQLWDTAGQERFGSVCRQYLRGADGVLLMYDSTAPASFTAVRRWISSLQEVIEDGAVVFLLGNKLDAAERDSRSVPRVEGKRLAKEYQAVFYECSALTGYNILEPMLHMARLLTAQEGRQRESALQLEDVSRRRGCCT